MLKEIDFKNRNIEIVDSWETLTKYGKTNYYCFKNEKGVLFCASSSYNYVNKSVSYCLSCELAPNKMFYSGFSKKALFRCIDEKLKGR